MSAGQNVIGQVIRFTANNNDDSIGGAQPSGTVVYTNVFGRISASRPTLALLEQGLETPNMFQAILSPSNIQLLNNDEFKVTNPPNSGYYNQTFRVVGNSKASMDDPRRFVKVTLRYIETQTMQ